MEERLQEMAAERAETLLEDLKLLSAPVSPLKVATTEEPLLILKGGNYRNRFDGQLEFHRKKNRFLLFFNTKYDEFLIGGGHHPRTRFSIAHELGHYFLEKHHRYLVRGGSTHRSKSEFFSHAQIEREADAFAAGLLMPRRLMRPLVNSGELSLERIEGLAGYFETSRVSAAIRAVQLSDFPCALAGIRGGAVAWTFLSPALKEAGCYPRGRGSSPHGDAKASWERMADGDEEQGEGEANIGDWFRTYDREHLEEIAVTESYLPVPSMETLLVLLTIDEDDLMKDDED
jgi:hypothetical protein